MITKDLNLRKRILFLTLLALLAASCASAQTRVLIGGEGGSSFGNMYVGPAASVEVPLGRRLTIEAKDVFSPLESHVLLGSGYANTLGIGGQVYLTDSFGINASTEASWYGVTKANKNSYYAFVGPTWRTMAWGTPTNFGLNYIRQYRNGISANGTETSQLQGGEFIMDGRLGCSGKACLRMQFSFQVGGVKNQSNPVCDGSFAGPVTCPRKYTLSGGVSLGLYAEFPRRRDTENLPF